MLAFIGNCPISGGILGISKRIEYFVFLSLTLALTSNRLYLHLATRSCARPIHGCAAGPMKAAHGDITHGSASASARGHEGRPFQVRAQPLRQNG